MNKKVIENFKPLGGKHCITNSLKQIFNYYGHPVSEEMLFGIGEGLDFTYIGLSTAPMVSGRSKIIEFEKTIATRFGIKININQNKDYNKIFAITKLMLDKEQPVFVYADMPLLRYLGQDEKNHFGGHAVVLFGYDDEQGCYYVSDRDNSDNYMLTPMGIIHEDYHLVDYTQMRLSRSSNFKPFPVNSKYAKFDFTGYQGISKAILVASIAGVCEKMLNPSANMKGVSGILKFSKEVRKWDKFDDVKLGRACITNYAMINEIGGTGGGVFRNMYGNFLKEAGAILQDNLVGQIGEKFIMLSYEWDTVAGTMWKLSETNNRVLLDVISCSIKKYTMRKRIY